MIDPVDTVVCQGVELLDWLPEELLAWDLPELVPTADWVEAHVKLAGRDVAIPGPIDLNLTPYLRGLFDALDDPAIETITGVFGTQLGKTTFLYGALLSTIRQRPGPALLVMPTEPDAREVAGGVLRNWVLDCEPVKALLADGETSLTKEGYMFAGSSLYFGWSNSAASLARRACRYAFYDEVEKFPPFVGRESNPLKLGDARLRTFRHTTGCKSVRVSSPTDRTGLIGKSFEASDQRSFWVPCPACGEYQVLTWKQVVWPKGGDGHSADPDVIREEDLARYQCPHCQAAWDDARRIAAVRRGVWARRGQRVGRDGLVAGAAERPRSSHAGFHVSALYSSFVRLSHLAADFLDARHDLAALMAFVQQELGEFWEESEGEVKDAELAAHVGGYHRGQAPSGVQVISAGVDVQRGWFVVEVRGWGYGLESWVLDARYVQTADELHEYLRDRRFERLAADGTPTGEELPIRLTLMDSGDQTNMVYDLCQEWADVDVRPTKGEDEVRGAAKVRSSPITKRPKTRRAYKRTMLLYVFDSNFHKDAQARLAAVSDEGPGYLHLPADLPGDWVRQFTAEHKVPDRSRGQRGRSGRPRSVWRIKHEHAANHYWDTAVLNTVAGDDQLLDLRRLRDPAAPVVQRRRLVGRMNMDH